MPTGALVPLLLQFHPHRFLVIPSLPPHFIFLNCPTQRVSFFFDSRHNCTPLHPPSNLAQMLVAGCFLFMYLLTQIPSSLLLNCKSNVRPRF